MARLHAVQRSGTASRFGHSRDIEDRSMVKFLWQRDEEGQGLAEYALILALIAIVAIAALLFLGEQISSILSTIGAAI
jgi:pilus assembly protein Flp/PilA